MPDFDLTTEVRDVVARAFHRPPPRPADVVEPVRFACADRPVEGFLVGLSDGRSWGWWGPVPEPVARDAVRLFHAAAGRSAGTPGQWTGRLRRGTRHAHTGVLAVATGAFELACWDLLGQRHGVPVWRLLADRPAATTVGSYATCFGIRLDDPRAPRVVERVAAVWPVQKWRPVRRLADPAHPASRALAAVGPGRLALDFGGTWPVAAVLRFCARLAAAPYWIEEPCAPGELSGLPAGPRPAPFAAGEHCYGPDETAILDAAGIEFWQPDAVFCGGLTALMAIAAIAAARGRLLFPHGGGLIPALHAAVAGSVTALLEFHLLLERRRQVHLANPVVPGPDGRFGLPNLPGWAGPLHPDLRS